MSISASPVAAASTAGSPQRHALYWHDLAEVLIVVAIFVGINLIPGISHGGVIGIAVCTVVVTFLLVRRGTGWSSLGLRGPKSISGWLKGAAMALLVVITASAINLLAMPMISALWGSETERQLPAVASFAQYAVLMGIVWTTAAFGEEMLFRGFLMARLASIFGGSLFAWILAALAQAVVFGLAHSYQGVAGIIFTGVLGLTFGLLYLIAQRNLWPMIIGHGIINSIGITILYLQSLGVMPEGSLA